MPFSDAHFRRFAGSMNSSNFTGARAIVEGFQRRHRTNQIFPINRQHQIDIRREAHIPVCHDGQAVDDQIPDLALIKRLNNGFNAGFFHAGTR